MQKRLCRETKMSNSISVAFRPVASTDIPLITNSWLKFWVKSPLAFGVHTHVFYKSGEVYIQRLLKRAGAIIACDPVEPDQIFGYVAGEYWENQTILHFLYVKMSFRKFGIGRALWEQVVPEKHTPFATTYLPEEKDLNAIYRQRAENPDTIEYQINKNFRKVPTISVKVDNGPYLCKAPKNSVLYINDKPYDETKKYRYIYNPFLAHRLETADTTPFAEIVR